MSLKKYSYFILCIFVSGCATATFRANPQLGQRIKTVKEIAVMPMDVEVYKVTAGGVKELVDEYTLEAKNNIKAVIDDELTISNNYKLVYLSDIKEITDIKQKLLFKDALALYSALDTSIIAHTYPPNMEYIIPLSGIFKDKLNNFDYTFGLNLSEISSYVSSDALLFTRGGDYLSSGGRVALMVWAAVMGFTPTRAGPPHLSLALVDPKTGDILWYNFLCPQKGYNFRNSESVRNFIKILLNGFPKNSK